jgi:ubiquinone/menaquinone biosynthesis C-methylase UbiE
MEQGVYDIEAGIEARHWWFRGRRMLFASQLAALGVKKNARLLDVGTGTGSNLRMLREEGFEQVTGIDLNPSAIRYCRSKGFTSVFQGDATCLPFANAEFDVVLATDAIEHIDDDREALKEIARVLAPGGYVMIVVPAFPSLWGLQDVVAHHKRRYLIADLIEKVRSSALEVRQNYYFNYLLFAPIWLARQLIRLLKIKRASEAEFNSAILNQLLYWVFAFDVTTAPLLHPPFGVSIMVVGQKIDGV